jgi:Zinc knuckle
MADDDEQKQEEVPPTPRETCIIGGVEIELGTTDHKVSKVETALNSKAARKELTESQKAELFGYLQRQKQSRRFEHVNTKIEDPETLKNTYNLQNLLNEARRNLLKYDMIQPFMIVEEEEDLEAGVKTYKTTDLFVDYANVTVKTVADSNKWYRTKPKDPKPFDEDLNISYDYLFKNTDYALQIKVLEKYNSYEPVFRGGSLFLKLVLDEITMTSTGAVEYLVSQVRKLNISEIQGQDVSKAVSMIRGAHMRLCHIKNPETKRNSVPDTFAKDVLNVMKTCTVPDFVDVFKTWTNLGSIVEISEATAGGQNNNPFHSNIEVLLTVAEAKYKELLSLGKWNETSSGGAVFNASDKKNRSTIICFNCGEEGHRVNECPKPKNQERIQKAAAEFKAKRGATGGKTKRRPTGKWKPPTDEERRNNCRRLIDNKMHHYDFTKKRWSPDRNQPQAEPSQASPAQVTPTSNAAPSAETTDEAKVRLAQANLTRAMSQAIGTFVTQLRDS